MAILTEEEFSKHVGTAFCATVGESEIELMLAEVQAYRARPTEQSEMARFSVFFEGPADRLIPQQSVHMHHEQMGEFEIFIVPVTTDAVLRYEAVFNYYK